jgi:catalase
MVGGVKASDGSWVEADEKIDGAPSVVFDAVAIAVSGDEAKLLSSAAVVRDFIADAFAHLKFIGYVAAAKPLLDKAGVIADSGMAELSSPQDVQNFVRSCRQIRHWEREARVKPF